MGPTAADQSWHIRLALCLRRIEEACTIEEALACHNEVLDLLAGQVRSVHLTSWPQAERYDYRCASTGHRTLSETGRPPHLHH